MKYQAKKSFGQNFLNDKRIQQKIIEACAFSNDDTVLEIGPGQGALTRLIAPHVKKLICVEADRDLIEPLRTEFAGTHVEIVHANFLNYRLPPGAKIFGNIPYNISTPILEKIIENRKHIAQAFLTVQLEFGQRLAAKPGAKDYGSLTCFVQYYADVKLLFKIKNTCFTPAPKVDSCFVSLAMKARPEFAAKDEAFLFKMIQTSFQQRRKTILNTLHSFMSKEELSTILNKFNIDPQARPEMLKLSDFINIANAFVI